MKAVLQNFKTGVLSVSDVPPPALRPGGILVRNAASLISAGTEKSVVELAKMSFLRKARTRPDLVKKVLNRARQDGILQTLQVVNNLVSQPLPLGYSCAGVVQASGEGAGEFRPGQRVACAGLGFANHADVVYVPRQLAVPMPPDMDFEEAAFVALGAIALHGVRRAEAAIGECIVVLGLGLVGQIAAQISRAAGCRVFGIDRDPARVKTALDLGIPEARSLDDPDLAGAVARFTRDRGADAVLITAATSDSQPAVLAAQLARDRARIVAVGETGLDLPRRAYFEKELDLRLSRSYGPGRYDLAYEEQGHDYPIGYVRWTENRNMEAFLDLVAQRKIQVRPLLTHRYPIERATEAYALLTGDRSVPYLGILLQYGTDEPKTATVTLRPPSPSTSPGRTIRVGVVGAGQFARGILLPNLAKIPDVEIVGVATGSGITARTVAEKYGARLCTSDHREILSRDDVDAVVIATRHDLHARMVVDALKARKHVFVEKPLCLNEEELASIRAALGSSVLMVGFNRRFSPMAVELQRVFTGGPCSMLYRVNAGPLPHDHWTRDPVVGGGRIVGEICHFVDLLGFLASSAPTHAFAWAIGGGAPDGREPDDLSAQVRFENGSLGTVLYTSGGDLSYPKERIEVFGDGTVGVIDNWRSLRFSGRRRGGSERAWFGSRKGHAEELEAWVRAVRDGIPPIPFEGLAATAMTTFALQRSLRSGAPVAVRFPEASSDAP